MRKLFVVAAVGSLLLLGYTSYLALYVAPPDQEQGEVQRIFYYHVPIAWAAMLCLMVNFWMSAQYLIRRKPWEDALAAASAEVGVVFCTLILITGPIWARPVWGIWWTWDIRLTTTLVLWLIYVSYLILRRFGSGSQTPVLAAALAVFGFLDVPLVYFSIRIFRTQHPQPVIGGGQGSGVMDPLMKQAFWMNVLAFVILGLMFLWARYAIQKAQMAVENQHAASALRDNAARGAA